MEHNCSVKSNASISSEGSKSKIRRRKGETRKRTQYIGPDPTVLNCDPVNDSDCLLLSPGSELHAQNVIEKKQPEAVPTPHINTAKNAIEKKQSDAASYHHITTAKVIITDEHGSERTLTLEREKTPSGEAPAPVPPPRNRRKQQLEQLRADGHEMPPNSTPIEILRL